MAGDSVARVLLTSAPDWIWDGCDTWMRGYLAGKPGPLPKLAWPLLSPFSRAVLDVMSEIPFGKTMTYGQLATAAGFPGAARAVGNVCNHNPFPLLIPCHRVVAAHGIGGFAYGAEIKARILAHEKRFELV